MTIGNIKSACERHFTLHLISPNQMLYFCMTFLCIPLLPSSFPAHSTSIFTASSTSSNETVLFGLVKTKIILEFNALYNTWVCLTHSTSSEAAWDTKGSYTILSPINGLPQDERRGGGVNPRESD